MIVFLGGMTFSVDWSGDEEELVVAAPAPATTTMPPTTTVAPTSTTAMPPTTTVAPTSTTTMPPTTTVAPTTTTTIPLGVEKGYLCFRINQALSTSTNEFGFPNNAGDLADDLEEQLVYAGVRDRYAGIVLTFVTTDSRSTRHAKQFNEYVLPLIKSTPNPDKGMFETAATRGFFEVLGGGLFETSGADEAIGKVPNGFRVDIYLLSDGEEHPELEEKTNLDCG
jgi:hypothetical protein